jgi:hypothetical protein
MYGRTRTGGDMEHSPATRRGIKRVEHYYHYPVKDKAFLVEA